MKKIQFTDENGSFRLEYPEKYSYLYFPLASEQGLKSAITPSLGGDIKIGQNSFLMEPVSVENLHNNRGTRNFWCNIKGKGCWSATGVSAEEFAKRHLEKQDYSSIDAGFMWHKVVRESREYGLRAEILSFIPVDTNVEVMRVSIQNIGNMQLTITPTAVIPIYGRSADNLRDHRHVTSLLHRIQTTEYGVEVTPTLSFDERGHQKNELTYFVCGGDETGNAPVDFYPTVEDFIWDGGTYECPYAVWQNIQGTLAGTQIDGMEAVGGLHFAEKLLAVGEKCSYTILLGITEEQNKIPQLLQRFLGKGKVEKELELVKRYWQTAVNVSIHTKEEAFDGFMKWVCFQPMLRRIFGCSFLPHHDYGKGGRGWRDLWQDCLALLIMNPEGVRNMLIANFAGVRMDGSNATIIGSKQGEFIADRNQITRVWMDHGVWPLLTTKLYINQTGDIEILEQQVGYFKDKQVHRGIQADEEWTDVYGRWQKDSKGNLYQGTILEHLLLQHLTAFYEVGEHNAIRLRGADWNDALDMAEEKGESVAFTTAYAGNLKDLAELLMVYQKKSGNDTVDLSKEMFPLLTEDEEVYASVEKRKGILQAYLNNCTHNISGEKISISISVLAKSLRSKASWMMDYIRKTEWVKDAQGYGWFNGYYDNHGKRVEGEFDTGIRMMLTSQVFSIMSNTANDKQVSAITQSVDKYLYQEELGGYRLNTNFHEQKMDLGRMFGFSYGDKENGGVFSHMAVMYANALYQRGFVKEGYKALKALEQQSMNFEKSHIYPGIPEYFNGKGRGMYHYLTGAASWYMLTVVTQMFGVRGHYGDLMLQPCLLAEQFDSENMASLRLQFAGKSFCIMYHNELRKEYGEYDIQTVLMDGIELDAAHIQKLDLEKRSAVILSREEVCGLRNETEHVIKVILK